MRWLAVVLIVLVALAFRVEVNSQNLRSDVGRWFASARDAARDLRSFASATWSAATQPRLAMNAALSDADPTDRLPLSRLASAPIAPEAGQLAAQPAVLPAVLPAAEPASLPDKSLCFEFDMGCRPEALNETVKALEFAGRCADAAGAKADARHVMILRQGDLICRLSCITAVPAIGSVGSPKSMNFMPWKKIDAGYHPSSGTIVARPSRS